MRTPERDPTLRRIERDTWIACAAMTLAAYGLSGGRLAVALGVLGGGGLAGLSYRAIKGGANAVAAGAHTGPADPTPPTSSRRGAARAVIVFVLRYALLAFLAYVMIARLRLHPIGLLVGASSMVVAVAVEALRLLRTRRR